LLEEIPPELIINFDQIDPKFVSVGDWTVEKAEILNCSHIWVINAK